MTAFAKIETKLKELARDLLDRGEVAQVIAYGRGYDDRHPQPCVARTAAEVDNLVFNEYCHFNLANYLTRVPSGTKVAIVVKGADSRAVVQLLQEEKVRREDLVLVGIIASDLKDDKTGEVLDAKTTCALAKPVLHDFLLGEPEGKEPADPYQVLAALEAQDGDARWRFWQHELGRCLRCFACRKACPLCYCDPCFMDLNRPRWAEKSPTAAGGIMYHLTRFYHLAGRCIDCGQCSRACPVSIPLYLFHKKLARDCEEMFGQAAGMKSEDKPVLVDFRVEDGNEILK
jgi:ferredoxin